MAPRHTGCAWAPGISERFGEHLPPLPKAVLAVGKTDECHHVGGLGRPFSSQHGHHLQLLATAGCGNSSQMWHVDSMCHCSLCEAAYLLCALIAVYRKTKHEDLVSFLLYSYVGRNLWQWGRENTIKSKVWGTTLFFPFFIDIKEWIRSRFPVVNKASS